jgi:HEAT repeat protein
MVRAAGVAVAISWIMAGRPVIADRIDDRVAELVSSDNYKLRLASAIALSKSSDSRALRALATLLDDGEERSLRRVAVLGLAKQLVKVAAPLRAELVIFLDRAATSDRDSRVRSGAAAAVRTLKKLAAEQPTPTAADGILREDLRGSSSTSTPRSISHRS